ncbi:hypothetical protein J6590_041203 [Homalodisca vitripennis]|nr:hypothetical protein J6590_041203 [Homalodisca vitripennis]
MLLSGYSVSTHEVKALRPASTYYIVTRPSRGGGNDRSATPTTRSLRHTIRLSSDSSRFDYNCLIIRVGFNY